MARKSKETSEQIDLTEQSSFVISKAHTEQEYQAGSATIAHSRCGDVLREARESQGLSVHEIASRLRLSPKQIEAIEADNFAVLPEPTIVRGFIRNYAKQLKINAQPLLDAYVVIVPSAAPHGLAVKPTTGMKMSSHEKSKSGSYALAALALLLALGIWLFYQHYIQKPSPTQPIATNSAVGESAMGQNAAGAPVLPEAALPAAERAAEPVTTDTQTTTVLTLPPPSSVATQATAAVTANIAPAAVSAAAPNISPPVVKSPSTPSSNSQLPNSQLTASTTLSAATVVAPETPPASMPKSLAKLEFNASQETWVNVMDANGKEVYSKIIFAGSRESIDVKLPVNVTVGNAGATSMSMNGKDIDLAPHSRNNVAHIKLDK